MTAREWLNVLAILESIDEVPGMPFPNDFMHFRDERGEQKYRRRRDVFREAPVKFLRKADDATRDAIWAEVERRLAGGA